MKVVVFGTGYVGRAIIEELAARGHQVVAVSRAGGADALAGSATDPDFVASATAGADAIVSALPSRTEGPTLAENLANLIAAADRTGARLAVVGGASTIPIVAGGPLEGDTGAFPAQLLPLHTAHLAARAELEASAPSADWVIVVPAGGFGPHKPGTRTGSYRSSTTAQVLDADGVSFIGVADYAIAFADELERPTVRRGWITVGY